MRDTALTLLQFQEHVRNHPELRYESYSGGIYTLKASDGTVVRVAAGRKAVSGYPRIYPSQIERAYYWLTIAALGLVLSGVVTVCTAPAALFLALPYMSDVKQRSHAYSIVIASGLLMIIGLAFSVLLVMHIVL